MLKNLAMKKWASEMKDPEYRNCKHVTNDDGYNKFEVSFENIHCCTSLILSNPSPLNPNHQIWNHLF